MTLTTANGKAWKAKRIPQRLTAQEGAALLAGEAVKKPTKYHNKRVTKPEGKFDSQAEYRRFLILRMSETDGHIRNLERQPRFDMVINGIKCGFYKADFAYFKGERRVIEDVKGIRTPVYRLKKRIVEALYGVEIVEVS